MDDALVRASKLLNNGLEDEAVAMITKRLESAPDDTDAYVLMAAAELLKGDFAKAVKPYLTAAVKLEPDSKKEFLDFAYQFSMRKECTLRGVHIRGHKNVDPFDVSAVVRWMAQTDRDYLLANEDAANLALAYGEITVDDFIKEFPRSERINGILMDRAWAEWYGDTRNPDEAKHHAQELIDRGPSNTEEVKQAKQLLRNIEKSQQQQQRDHAEEQVKAVRRQLVGVWEHLGGAFQTTIEFIEDGTWIFRVGALQEIGGYSLSGNKITMWGTSSFNGKPIPASSGTWTLSGDNLTITGPSNMSASGRYRRMR